MAGPLEAVESFAHELHRHEITSVRQLQRALQAKIGQQTRGAVPIFRVFQRLDRRRVGLVDAADLHAALETFNLEAPDELVSQLVTSLDLDHDGALCLSEFVAGARGQPPPAAAIATDGRVVAPPLPSRAVEPSHPQRGRGDHAVEHPRLPRRIVREYKG